MPQSCNQQATKLSSLIHFLIMIPYCFQNMCFKEEANNKEFLSLLRFIYIMKIRPCYTFFSILAWEQSHYGHEDVYDYGRCHGHAPLRHHGRGSDHVYVCACVCEHEYTPPVAGVGGHVCLHVDACCYSC